jgi:hypothetical protein
MEQFGQYFDIIYYREHDDEITIGAKNLKFRFSEIKAQLLNENTPMVTVYA